MKNMIINTILWVSFIFFCNNALASTGWIQFFDNPIFKMYGNIRVLIYLTLIIINFSLILCSIISFIINNFKKVKFDYKNEYQKFGPKSKVKITFMDGKNELTRKVRILSINAKGISFEDRKTVYKCTPLEIINIREESKKILIWLLIITTILLFLGLMDIIYWATLSPTHSYIEPGSCEGVVGPCL